MFKKYIATISNDKIFKRIEITSHFNIVYATAWLEELLLERGFDPEDFNIVIEEQKKKDLTYNT